MKYIYLGVILLLALASCQHASKQEGNQQTMGSNTEAVNATIETILNRRSIRAYKPEQVRKDELEQIITCGINAPSALNRQPWEICVIQNSELIGAINEGFVKFAAGQQMQGSASRAQEPGFSVFHGAPTVIVVANDTTNHYSQVDCGLMGQNILLSAESLGIGTCVIGGVIGFLNTPEGEKFVSRLNLSKDYRPLYTIAVGYKAEQPEARPRDISKISFID